MYKLKEDVQLKLFLKKKKEKKRWIKKDWIKINDKKCVSCVQK